MPSSSVADFDPRTAYRDDWRYVDGVVDGVLLVRKANAESDEQYPVKLLRADVTRRDFQRLGIAVAVSPEEAAWFLWPIHPDDDALSPPEPRVDDALELQLDGEEQPQRWLIQQVQESQVGSLYVLGCVKGRVNAY